MKKYLRVFAVTVLALIMVMTLCGCSAEAAEKGGVAMELTVTIAARILEALLAIMGAWLLAKLGKRTELSNVREAMENVIDMAIVTVGELQQTFVNRWKEENGGKLDETDIANLQEMLIRKTIEKLSDPVIQLIEAAGMDLEAIIQGAAEDWLNERKGGYWNHTPVNTEGETAPLQPEEGPEIIQEDWPEEDEEDEPAN
ncbi:MAG: hypothetical protein IKI35_05770 [Stomatobaculum sp.]|nr:hypothetical protein [Stomatobaculum sp.]